MSVAGLKTGRPVIPFTLTEDTTRKGTAILESTLTANGLGRRSFYCREPFARITGHDNTAEITIREERKILPCRRVSELAEIIDNISDIAGTDLFAAGFIGYEFACRSLFDNGQARRAPEIPEFAFYLYRSVLVYNHTVQSFSRPAAFRENYRDIVNINGPENRCEKFPTGQTHANFSASITKNDYLEKVNLIKHCIREGQIYQANLTNRFTAQSELPGHECYLRLRKLNPAPYSAYLNFGDFEIISSSPERLVTKTGDRIETRPIKGTCPRGTDPGDDLRLRNELVNSEKDRAELLMITDLARNDLGMVAAAGSVEVPALFKPETYSSVHHLVSYVRARLDPAKSASDLLEAVLPGGSITGAPKKRAVEILQEIEPVPRLVYTGSIGYFHQGNIDFNIAIRTILKKGKTYMVNAGGGIVADSQPEAEYREMMLKARNLFAAVSDSYEVEDG